MVSNDGKINLVVEQHSLQFVVGEYLINNQLNIRKLAAQILNHAGQQQTAPEMRQSNTDSSAARSGAGQGLFHFLFQGNDLVSIGEYLLPCRCEKDGLTAQCILFLCGFYGIPANAILTFLFVFISVLL